MTPARERIWWALRDELIRIDHGDPRATEKGPLPFTHNREVLDRLTDAVVSALRTHPGSDAPAPVVEPQSPFVQGNPFLQVPVFPQDPSDPPGSVYVRLRAEIGEEIARPFRIPESLLGGSRPLP